MKYRILIVDDSRDLRELLRHVFELNGFTVDTASCGYEAFVPLIQDELPSAVIVGDLSPRPDTSLALVNDIKTAFVGRPLPIVMVSTQAKPADVICGLASGADRYVAKPFRARQLVETIKELLTSTSNT